MRVLHDYECRTCGHIHEEYIEHDNKSCLCPVCIGPSIRIYIRFNGIKNTSPNWLKDVVEVVDKSGGQHCKEFIKNPTRDTYNDWMKKESIRPMEPGEIPTKAKVDNSELRKKIKDNFVKNNAITVRG